MPGQGETIDAREAIDRLNAALVQQYRSALQYSVVASSLRGLEAQALGEKLKGFGYEELSGVRLLIEKIVALGGRPTLEIAELRFHEDPDEAIEWLVACEEKVVDSLQEAIEPTGREARSEALEHLLEHLIMRKQQQIDYLKRAIGFPASVAG
jgi:bacterioferritin (cytochrome b1)